ncbi:MAG: O-antigen ligase family protein [Parasphingorhabdus sp.]|nr:O-antigen ligase family protein [Parasphingorhabdus sp.]
MKHRHSLPSWSLSGILHEVRTQKAAGALYFLIVAAILFGGGPNKPNISFLVITSISIILLGFALYSNAWQKFRAMPLIIQFFGWSLFLTPLIQLIPFPPLIWQLFPGRATEYAIIAQLEESSSWRSISLDWDTTLFSFFVMLTPISAFFGALCLSKCQRQRAIKIVLGVSLIAFIVGTIQFLTSGRLFTFYEISHHGSFLGFFANRNHTSLFFAIILSLAFAAIRTKRHGRKAALFYAACLVGIAAVVALGSSSRAGYLLLVVSVGASLLWRFGIGLHPLRNGLLAILVLSLIVMIANQASSVAEQSLNRFEFIGDGDRVEKWYYTTIAALKYFPFGSGLGTFVPVYAKFEQLDIVTPFYVNHAHNDYLELFLEAGLLGLFITVLFLAAYIRACLHGRLPGGRYRSQLLFALKLIPGLVLLHSLVDYPLRTPAIAVLFSISLGFLWSILYLENDELEGPDKRLEVQK